MPKDVWSAVEKAEFSLYLFCFVCYLGVKKEPGTDDFLLQVTNYVKDVSISALSDDDFSKVICLENIVHRVSIFLAILDVLIFHYRNCWTDVHSSLVVYGLIIRFSENTQEECEDLHQRIKNGSPKQPTIVSLLFSIRRRNILVLVEALY